MKQKFESIGKTMPCDVPEHFFEDITADTLAKIERLQAAKQDPCSNKEKTARQPIRPLYRISSLAAAFVALFAITLFLVSQFKQDKTETEALPITQATEQPQLEQYLDELSNDDFLSLVLMLK